jgi:uncharacterized protein YbjT (DUF2867 family)
MAPAGPVLVVGATGALGGRIARRLAAGGQAVAALVREPGSPRAQALAEQGIELRHADLGVPDQVRRAMAGAEAVVFTATSADCKAGTGEVETADRRGLVAVVDTAEALGVRHLVYVSMSGGIDVPNPLLAAKRDAEQHILRSTLPYTIVRPTFFIETWFLAKAGYDIDGGLVKLYGDGTHPVGFIAVEDVAAAVCAALHHHEARFQIIELGGPEAIRPREAISMVEAAFGKKLEIQQILEADLLRAESYAEEPVLRSVLALRRALAHGDVPGTAWLDRLGIAPTTLGAWLQNASSIRRSAERTAAAPPLPEAR